jgi:thiamine-phosphate pyrophosphorylase
VKLRPRLIALSDTTRCSEAENVARFERLAAAARPGSVMIQLRDRELDDRRRIAFGTKLRDATWRHEQLFAVNDRGDLALLLEADALHLGEASVRPAEARRIVGGMWLSRACHDPARATADGADAIVLSPILAERKGATALGVEALTVARRAAGFDVLLYALGGIDAAGVGPCLAAGADGVAAIGAALDADDPIPLVVALGIAREEH